MIDAAPPIVAQPHPPLPRPLGAAPPARTPGAAWSEGADDARIDLAPHIQASHVEELRTQVEEGAIPADRQDSMAYRELRKVALAYVDERFTVVDESGIDASVADPAARAVVKAVALSLVHNAEAELARGQPRGGASGAPPAQGLRASDGPAVLHRVRAALEWYFSCADCTPVAGICTFTMAVAAGAAVGGLTSISTGPLSGNVPVTAALGTGVGIATCVILGTVTRCIRLHRV